MLVFQTDPVGVEPNYAKMFFCSNKFASLLVTWLKTLYTCTGSPHVIESNIVLDSGFRIPGNWLQCLSVELGFWIPIVSGIPYSLHCIPDSKAQISDSTSKNFPESGFPYTRGEQEVPSFLQQRKYLCYFNTVLFYVSNTELMRFTRCWRSSLR